MDVDARDAIGDASTRMGASGAPSEAELRRKYELLRKKREERAAREVEKASSASANARVNVGVARDPARAVAGGRVGGAGGRGGGTRSAAAGRVEAEPVDPAIERAKAILAGLHRKKQPGVASLNLKAGGEDAAEVVPAAKPKAPNAPKLVFTMGKREVKSAPAPMIDDDGPIGYAPTVAAVPKAPEPVPEPEPKLEPKPAPATAAPPATDFGSLEPKPTLAALEPEPEGKIEAKRDIKRPGLLKRPGVLSPEPAKRAKLSAPTPFTELTDGVGERSDKTTREVWIGDLPDGCTVESLSMACYRYGRVNSCRVIERKNFGFVTFADSASAEKIVNTCIAHMNDPDKEPVIVNGRIVFVEYSDSLRSGGQSAKDELRRRAEEELERIRDGEIIEDVQFVKRDVVVYDDI